MASTLEYMIVSAFTTKSLANKIRPLMLDGYRPHGSLVIKLFRIYQVMVKFYG